MSDAWNFDRSNGSYIANAWVESIATRGLLEGELAAAELQELCGAVLAEIEAQRKQNVGKPER